MLKTVCPHDCPDTCGIVATVENGRVVKVDGDPAHPFTRGFLCHKVACYDERIYSPHRVLHPMVRKAKGGPLVRATWDEAIEIVCARLGSGESVLPYSYGGTMGLVQRAAGHPFFHRLGACRLLGTICDEGADAAWKSMIGRTIGTDPERVAESDHVLVWGSNASVVNIHQMPFIREAQKRGAKLVVVDPYRTETAKMADDHVAVRAGTDAALALGMARVMVDEGLVDRDYIASRTEGFDRFAASLPDVARCERICGVRDIPRLAREFARAKAPYIRFGVGFSRHANGGQAVRAVLALAALVGAFRRGGALFETWEAFDFDMSVLRRPDLLARETRQVNMVRLGEALTQDDRVRSIFVYGCNPAAVAPDQTMVRRGLARADLFVVVHEQMLTDTTDFADVVLPAPTSFETSDVYRSYGHYYLQRARPVIAPAGEARSNVELFNALAKRLGFNHDIFDRDAESRIELLMSTLKTPIDRAAFDRGEPVRMDFPRGDCFERGFPTPSGRFLFANGGVPAYVPCPEGHEHRGSRLQLLVPSGKHFLNSTFGAVPSLVARQKRATVLLHPDEAARRGLADGQLARVYNERGETQAHVMATDDVPPGVAVLPGLWWGRHTPSGVSANALTSQRLSDLGESTTLHCALCEVASVVEKEKG